MGSSRRRRRVTSGTSVTEWSERLGSHDFARARPTAAVLHDLASLLREGTLHATHPRYFGLFVPAVPDAAVWASALSALYNPQLAAGWHAPAASAVEAHVLAFLARALRYDARTAHFTTGASEAHLTAVVAAITARFPEVPARGLGAAAGRPGVYLSSQAHHSLHKAVRIAGLGAAAIREIPCDRAGRMRPDALGRALARDSVRGVVPCLVVGTLGTTATGATDGLRSLTAIAHRWRAWFHVDAAWAGAACFVPRLRPLLDGIGDADSVAWDAHKWLSAPMGTGMYFSRHPDVLPALLDVAPPYLPDDDDGPEPYRSTLQWSRRFAGSAVFAILATRGREGLARGIERQLAVAETLRASLREAGWRIVNDSELPLICFTHPSLGRGERVTEVARRVVVRGRAWISVVTLPDGVALRACITNDASTTADVEVLLSELERARRRP